MERHNEDKRLIVNMLKVINPDLSEQNAIGHWRLGLLRGKETPFTQVIQEQANGDWWNKESQGPGNPQRPQ